MANETLSLVALGQYHGFSRRPAAQDPTMSWGCSPPDVLIPPFPPALSDPMQHEDWSDTANDEEAEEEQDGVGWKIEK